MSDVIYKNRISNTVIDTLDTKLETLSDKYKLVPTLLIRDRFESLGFVVDSYKATRVRKKSKEGYQKHIVRLSNPSLLSSVHDDIKLQLIFTNSHDGLSGTKLQLGIYRLVCKNGLMAGTMFESISLRHTGKILEQIEESIMRIAAQTKRLDAVITAMKNRQLTAKEQYDFLTKAVALRYGDTKQPNDIAFITHRPEDLPKDVFTFMNMVQENLIRGGNEVVGSNGRVRTARAVTAINTTNLINTGIFDLAQELITEEAVA